MLSCCFFLTMSISIWLIYSLALSKELWALHIFFGKYKCERYIVILHMFYIQFDLEFYSLKYNVYHVIIMQLEKCLDI